MDRTADETEQPVGGVIVTPARRRWRVSAILAWVVVTPFAAWAVTRVGGLERGSFATPIMTATPYAAAGSLLPVLIAALSRSRWAIAVALVTTVALGFSVLPRAVGSSDTAGGRPLKVLTINMLYGRADTEAVIDLVKRLDPDVVSAQELTTGMVEDLDAAGFEQLMPYRHLQDEWNASGSGTYAKYPLTPVTDLFQPIGHNMPVAKLALPGGPSVEIVNVHPVPPIGRQTSQWAAAFDAFPAPSKEIVRVLAGDFNASLDHAALRRLLGRGYLDAADQVGEGLTPTWPANGSMPPIITIDHVLVDRRASVRTVSVHTVPGTDHRAVFAELGLPVAP
ncbi:endonuclease/exonuclease/phosphatase family protein [Streptosporangium sp. KLBMP 9127]|nr:endonuclease/exonuclease/phosphatase family protein [Streptosporangium sp. KLBMP 9127]